MPTLLRNFRSRTISTQTGNESLIPFDILARALLAYYAGLGINHQSPLIHLRRLAGCGRCAGNQSPIPFDILARALLAYYAGLGINHQSPLIHFQP